MIRGWQDRPAFTIVELLVSLAIIGVLVGLLLPAVQAARESARTAVCNNNLHQLGVAVEHHLATYQHYPAGGWGASWTGDPRRGYGVKQPGGWIFGLLGFMELQALRSDPGDVAEPTRKEALAEKITVVISTLVCPSRRPAVAQLHAKPYALANANAPPRVGRSDYAMNGGDAGSNTLASDDRGGPASLLEGDTTFPWPSSNFYNGLVCFRRVVGPKDITDGLFCTYLIGEKYLSTLDYGNGTSDADRGFALIGFAPDTVRLTRRDQPPRSDGLARSATRFGAAHQAACGFLFADGSVRRLSYDIDPEIHRTLGNTADGVTGHVP